MVKHLQQQVTQLYCISLNSLRNTNHPPAGTSGRLVATLLREELVTSGFWGKPLCRVFLKTSKGFVLGHFHHPVIISAEAEASLWRP